MNHNCHGDYIPTLRLYRCLLDSTFIRDIDHPAVCPHCKRPALPINQAEYSIRKVVCEFIVIDGHEYLLNEVPA